MQPYVDDVGYLILEANKQGKRIVFEGAHAALLDVDHGTYPYVTSSNCSSLGLFTGSGMPPQMVQNFLGIMKAYSTRVGGGPFPTEQDNDIGNYIRERGNEYGTTTRRPRRCGWFDAVAVKYCVDLCGITAVALTLLDVLSGLDHIQICTGYKYHGSTPRLLPRRHGHAGRSRTDLRNPPRLARKHHRLPTISKNCHKRAQQYVKRVEQLIGVPIKMVSVGPERECDVDSIAINRRSKSFPFPAYR